MSDLNTALVDYVKEQSKQLDNLGALISTLRDMIKLNETRIKRLEREETHDTDG